MDEARSRADARLAGRLYVVYVVLAVAGAALKSVELSLIGTAAYFVLAVQLYRLLAPIDRRVAIALLPLAALGCVIQGAGMAEASGSLQRLALVFFALFLVALGYLVARSVFLPRAVGIYLALAGAAWLTVVIPNMPTFVAAGLMAIGGFAELVFALWLLFGRIGQPDHDASHGHALAREAARKR